MTTEERLEKLERKYRRLLIGGGCLVVLLMGAMISGAAFPQDEVNDEVRARKFIMVDKNGKVRATLTANEKKDTGFKMVPCVDCKGTGVLTGIEAYYAKAKAVAEQQTRKMEGARRVLEQDPLTKEE